MGRITCFLVADYDLLLLLLTRFPHVLVSRLPLPLILPLLPWRMQSVVVVVAVVVVVVYWYVPIR